MKKKISIALIASILGTNMTPAINVFADEVLQKQMTVQQKTVEEAVVSTAKISKFILNGYKNFEKYNNEYKVSRDEIKGILNNGGQFQSSSIDKAIDGNMATHWETNTQNSSTFKNEVVVEFKDVQNINRMAYATRQDGAKGKGYPTKFKIYASETENDDYRLVTEGTSSVTGDLMEFKFNTVSAKKIKFVFQEANLNWASASEMWFYKEDKIIDKFSEIFTDSTMSEVSSDFNTVEKINEFKEEAKEHPLYNDFQEDLENALSLIKQGKIEATKAIVSKFTPYYTSTKDKYDEMFRISNDKIASITNNGGSYPGTVLKNAIDDNMNTHWETYKQNSDSFKNEVILTLKNEEELNRIVYKARNGNKGFANEFSIYVSSATKGDNFQKVSSGKATTTSDLIEIKFDNVKAKRVKFVFEKADQNWASIGELRLYKQDTLADEINNIFEDKIMSTLKNEYNNKEKINELDEKLENHPSKESLKYIIDAAKDVLSKENVEDKVLTLSQRGNNSTDQVRTQTVFSLYSPDVTGYYATPGETIKVYVDFDENGPKPKIMFGQIGDWKNGVFRTYTLKAGYNEITVPNFDDITPSAIYFLSDSLPGQQSYATKIRFEGGTKFPLYVHGKTDPDKFVEELREYLKEVNYNDEEVAKGNGKYNICEVTSENIIISTSAAGALVGVEADLKKGKDISYCMDLWEELYYDFAKMSGYEMEDETDPNYRPRGKFNLRVFTHGSYGWGAGGYSGYNGGNTEKRNTGFFSSFTNSSTLTSGGWAVPHEIGHQFDNTTINRSESTNNLYSLMLQDKYLENNRFVTGNLWRNDFTAYHNTKNYPSGDYFLFCGVVYQLYAQFGDNVYGEAQKVARERRSELTGLNNKQRLAVTLSLATGYDLLYHFEYYNVEMNDKARELVKGLKQLDKKTYYNNNKSINEEAKAFKNADVKPTIKVASSTDTSITLKMNIDEDDDRLLLYEVYRDGKFLGITYDENTFVDKNIKKGVSYEYSVIAYDRQLNTSKESDKVVKNLNEPKITVKEEKTTLKLRDEFNVSDVVKATDYNGNDITKDVKIVKGEVNTSKVGTYDLLLSVTHENLTSTKEVSINVLSNYEYLSDLKEKSSKVGWSVLRKDKSVNNTTITLLRNNAQVTYEKGLGAHANSEIVYDVEDLGFEYFESKIGVDQSMAGRASSVTFEVYADGVKKYESKVFKHNTNEESIKVDIKGAKEVKLVTTTAGDGDTADHSIWADAKFTTSNSKPQLKIPSSTSVKVGQSIDLNGEYSANDIEDGDLTKKVKVSGIEDVNFNKTGKYEITYSVKDSDGNKVVKTRQIHVVSLDDFEYLTDFNYKSANQSYGSLKINTSNSGNKIRLTDENNKEVVYEKGLGAHSTSTVIYDLTKLDKEYSRFTSFVGVDRQMYNSVGSVEFKVYVDGNLKYTSGVMTSRQAQKFVDVDIAGAKELKLVVTDGNNGNGSDHGDWADAKLVFAKENSIDLSEQVNIKDTYLKKAIKSQLNLSSNTITVGDMLNLTTLSINGAESLEGLQYAKNLQTLNIEYNEITDLSPLKKLKKLTNLNANNQILVKGMASIKNDKITVDYSVINRDGEKLSPKTITATNNKTKESTTFDVKECVDEKGVISVNTAELESGVYSLYLVYEEKDDNYSAQVLYMFSK